MRLLLFDTNWIFQFRLGPYGRPLGQQFGHLGPFLEPSKYGFGPYAPTATPGIVGPLLGGGLLGHTHGLGFPPIGFGHHPFGSPFPPYPMSHPGMMPMQFVHGLGHSGGIHQCHGDDGCCTPGRPCGRNEVRIISLTPHGNTCTTPMFRVTATPTVTVKQT